MKITIEHYDPPYATNRYWVEHPDYWCYFNKRTQKFFKKLSHQIKLEKMVKNQLAWKEKENLEEEEEEI